MSDRRMLILSEADVAAVLSMSDVIEAVERGLRAQAQDKIVQPVRSVVRTTVGMFGSMPCSIDGTGLGAKLVTFFPDNAKLGLHTHNAIIELFDPQTGVPSALLDGRLVTEMRTAATSAIATRLLAPESARVAAIIGTGVQARSHVLALQAIGMLHELRIWGRTADNAKKLAGWAGTLGITASVSATIADACRGAQVVCTLTPSTVPIVDDADIDPGTHINAVGSSAPSMQELAPKLVGRARVFVDTIEGAMRESGDILRAIDAGALPKEPELARLCDVLEGSVAGRRSPGDVTVFKSLGMAIEDVACAAVAVQRAREKKIGTEVAV